MDMKLATGQSLPGSVRVQCDSIQSPAEKDAACVENKKTRHLLPPP